MEGQSAPLRSGDFVKPAALLEPGSQTGSHSIVILLPDGQRLLYECFTQADCARGFRIPSLTRPPDAFGINLLARIHAVLAAPHAETSSAQPAGHLQPPPRDQAVTPLNGKNQVHLAGLITLLPNGRYTYTLRPLYPAGTAKHDLVLEKTQPSVELTLPAPGLYSLVIADAQNTPRVDFFLAAIRPAQAAHFQSFHRAQQRMEDWNDDYAGWPIDDFLRAYLQSLMQSAQPPSRKL